MRLVADRPEARDALFQRRVVEIGDAGLDGVIEPLQAQVGLGCALVQLGDVLAAPLGALLSAVEDGRQDLLEPFRLEQAVGDVLRNEIVQLLHRDRAALAARLALPRLDRAGVIAIPPSLSGPERHRAAAVGAEADAGKKGWAAHDARRRDLRIAGAQMRLDGIERRLIDQRRHFDSADPADGFQRLVLGALVELVPADISRPGQDAMDLPDPPASAVARKDALLVEMGGYVLDAHRAVRAIALQGEPVNLPHRVSVQRIDLQLLLDLGATLLGRDDAVADRRQGAVPEALPGVLLQRAEKVLGVLLRLVLIEQRHDLPHHDVHWIVAHLLGDRDEPDAILGEPADVELKLEVIAEEAREAVDDHDIEGCGLARTRFDHALELRPAVVRGRCARLDIGPDKLIAACSTVRFALPLLIGNRDIVLGLPRRRDPQVEGGAQRQGHGKHLLRSSARLEQLIEELAEPRLEHVEFGVADRHRVGPIVRNGPRLNVIFGRASDARPRLDRNVKVIGQHAQDDGTSRHRDRIAPRASGMNGRSLSRSILPPSGRRATLTDGGFAVDMIDVLIKTYGKALLTDGRKAQSIQATARAGWRAFSLAVQFLPDPIYPNLNEGAERATITASSRPHFAFGLAEGRVRENICGSDVIREF